MCSTQQPNRPMPRERKCPKPSCSNSTNVSAVYSTFMSYSFLFFPNLALQVAIITKNNRVLCSAINSSYHLFSAVSNAMSVFHRHAILRNATLSLLHIATHVFIQIAPDIARGERERALCHLRAARAHGKSEEVVFVLCAGRVRWSGRAGESRFLERTETSTGCA